MRFTYSFSRVVGAAPGTALGTDSVPTSHADLTDSNVFHSPITPTTKGKLMVAYVYTGAGPAPDLTAQIYLFDGTSQSWLTVGTTTFTLRSGDTTYVSVPAILARPQVAGGDALLGVVNVLDIALVVSAAGGEPDGTYTFLMAIDTNQIDDEAAAVEGLTSVAGATSDAKVDTDAVGTISAKLRGMVSRLVEILAQLVSIENILPKPVFGAAVTDTNHAAGAVPYPDANGWDITGKTAFSIWSFVTDATFVVQGTVESAPAETDWIDISKSCKALVEGAAGTATFGLVGGSKNNAVLINGWLARRVRVLVTYPDGTNAVKFTPVSW